MSLISSEATPETVGYDFYSVCKKDNRTTREDLVSHVKCYISSNVDIYG